jgi:hypothetical protein
VLSLIYFFIPSSPEYRFFPFHWRSNSERVSLQKYNQSQDHPPSSPLPCPTAAHTLQQPARLQQCAMPTTCYSYPFLGLFHGVKEQRTLQISLSTSSWKRCKGSKHWADFSFDLSSSFSDWVRSACAKNL